MTQKLAENGKDDTGYYTPKNILNPAMFRLAEITRALSEVNMEIEQEKLFEHRRHTINVEQLEEEELEEINEAQAIEVIEEGICSKPKKQAGWLEVLERNEDNIGKGLVISLFFTIALFFILLLLWY